MRVDRHKRRAIVLGLAVAALLGELAARWRIANPALPPEDYWPAPRHFYAADAGTGFTLSPGFRYAEEQWTTNDLGFRDRPRTWEREEGTTLRVAVLGDSFTAGVGVADGRAWPALLETALAAQGVHTEWWNLAVPHFGTEQMALRLDSHWEALRPDVVLVASFEGNDAWDDAVGPGHYRVRDGVPAKTIWAPWPPSPYDRERAEANRPLFAHHLPGDAILYRSSALYRTALHGVGVLRSIDADRWPYGMEPFDYEAWGGMPWLALDPLPPPVEAGWRIQERVLDGLSQRAAGRSVAVGIAGIPMKVEVDRGDFQHAMARGWELGPRPGGGARDGRRSLDLDQPMQRLQNIAIRIKVPFVDLRPPLAEAARSERTYYADDSHWNGAGHRVAAGAILAFAVDQGWLAGVDLVAATRWLERIVPPGSSETRFEGGFRPQRAGHMGNDIPPGGERRRPDRRGGGGGGPRDRQDDGDDGQGREEGDERGGKSGKGGKGGSSEVSQRFLAPTRLAAALPTSWNGAPCPAPEIRDEPLPSPREECVVRVGRTKCGAGPLFVVIDGGGQAEITEFLRGEARLWRVGPLPAGLPREAARFSLTATGLEPAALAAVPLPGFDALETELTEGGVGSLFVAEDPGPEDTLRARLVDPMTLVSALPAAPAGWQAFDAVPLYRPHDPPNAGEALAAAAEHAITTDPRVLRGTDQPWTAQVKRWYRGPYGAFEAVVQDSGRQEALLRAREALAGPARRGERPTSRQEDGRDLPTVAPFDGGGVQGFRTCLQTQGLCKVVAPLLRPGDDNPVVARFNLIVMGPAAAPDSAFSELAAALPTAALPPVAQRP